jgi:hypothetical protein
MLRRCGNSANSRRRKQGLFVKGGKWDISPTQRRCFTHALTGHMEFLRLDRPPDPRYPPCPPLGDHHLVTRRAVGPRFFRTGTAIYI